MSRLHYFKRPGLYLHVHKVLFSSTVPVGPQRRFLGHHSCIYDRGHMHSDTNSYLMGILESSFHIKQ